VRLLLVLVLVLVLLLLLLLLLLVLVLLLPTSKASKRTTTAQRLSSPCWAWPSKWKPLSLSQLTISS
jgi:hypothetical protein